MASGSLARRYARALLEIGVAEKRYEQLGREVAVLAEAVRSSRELAETLTNPAFPRDDREKVLKAVMHRLGTSPTVVNFTRLLLDRERVAALPDISRELAVMIDELAGRVKALVTSAQALSVTQEQQLMRTLEGMSGKKVELEKVQDPDILGGVIAKVGDMVYDGSLRTQLERLRHDLVK
jgi:F-type H+-transporting ATPase subunit delta